MTLFAADKKFFADVAIGRVQEVEKLMLEFMDAQHSKELAVVRATGVVSDEHKESFTHALEGFRIAHQDLFTAK